MNNKRNQVGDIPKDHARGNVFPQLKAEQLKASNYN